MNAAHAARADVQTAAGLALAALAWAGIGWLALRRLPPGAARSLVLLGLLPGLGLAALPDWARPSWHGRAGWVSILLRGAGLAPLALVGPAGVRPGLSADLTRAARGLGAGPVARLALLWWPAYARALWAGLALVLAASVLLGTLEARP